MSLNYTGKHRNREQCDGGAWTPTLQSWAGCMLVCSPPKQKYEAKVLLQLKEERDICRGRPGEPV